jgi:hypothetical protein
MKTPHILAVTGLLVGVGGIATAFANPDLRASANFQNGRPAAEQGYCRHEQHFGGQSTHCYRSNVKTTTRR